MYIYIRLPIDLYIYTHIHVCMYIYIYIDFQYFTRISRHRIKSVSCLLLVEQRSSPGGIETNEMWSWFIMINVRSIDMGWPCIWFRRRVLRLGLGDSFSLAMTIQKFHLPSISGCSKKYSSILSYIDYGYSLSVKVVGGIAISHPTKTMGFI